MHYMCIILNLVYDLFIDKDSSMNVLISVFPYINDIVQIDYVEKDTTLNIKLVEIESFIANFDIQVKNQILRKKLQFCLIFSDIFESDFCFEALAQRN